MNRELFFESAGDERGTPQEFFDTLNAEFQFDIDCAASPENTKCSLYFGHGGVAENALDEDWGAMTCWLNPPYSVAGAFVAKAREEADKGATVVLLLPARTDTKWWHRFCWSNETHAWREGVSGRLIPGRLSFELKVPAAMRALIIAEFHAALGLGPRYDEGEFFKKVIETTGLPKMAIEGVINGKPDEDLLSSAPFPSAVVIFRSVQ